MYLPSGDCLTFPFWHAQLWKPQLNVLQMDKMSRNIVFFIPLLFLYMSCTSSADDKAKRSATSERARERITVTVDTARIAPLERFVRTGGAYCRFTFYTCKNGAFDFHG